MVQPKSRVGIDTAGGGLITGPGCSTVLVNGYPTAVVGDSIAPHGPPPHDKATIIQGSTTITAGGKPVAYLGCLCSCGHTLQSGSLNVETT